MQNIPAYKVDPHLRRLPHESLRDLARRGHLVRYKANSQVITQGQTGHEIFVVLDGRLEAYIHSNGRKERRLTLATLHSGDIFGEIGIEGAQRALAHLQGTQAARGAALERGEQRAFHAGGLPAARARMASTEAKALRLTRKGESRR